MTMRELTGAEHRLLNQVAAAGRRWDEARSQCCAMRATTPLEEMDRVYDRCTKAQGRYLQLYRRAVAEGLAPWLETQE